MVHLGVVASDSDSNNAIVDHHVKKCLAKIHDDWSHGKIPLELKSNPTPSRCESGTTTREDIDTYRKHSGADDTQTRTTIILVHQILYRRSFGEWMFMNEGTGTPSYFHGNPTKTHGRSCTSVDELTIPQPHPISCFPRRPCSTNNEILWDLPNPWTWAKTVPHHAEIFESTKHSTLWVLCIYHAYYQSM